MAEKSHPFSIYLLKPGFDAANSLADDHELQQADGPTQLPAGATLYILDAERKRPWWRTYFGVQEELWQQFKGALLFLEAGGRCFALSFGQVQSHLKDEAYEYDFGLRVTLNCLDPRELKSADMIEPGPARRKRTQVPISTELTFLDFDGNSEIIKSLTGKVKEEYRNLFKTATGSASLKISMKIAPNDLAARCQALLARYEAEDYKETFPNIQNIVPVKDPTKIGELDGLLLESIRANDGATTLTIPDIVDFRDNTCCVFTGPSGVSKIYPDISIEQFYEYLGDGFNLAALTLEQLKSYRMNGNDADEFVGPFEHSDFKVIFGIITHKQPAVLSDALPLFSKISLMRNMQRLDLMRVPTALTFIPDQSAAKGGHAKHRTYIVEVCAGPNGNEIKPIAGQGLNTALTVKRCPQAIKDSAVGSRYSVTVKEAEDGTLSSYHGWPFAVAA